MTLIAPTAAATLPLSLMLNISRKETTQMPIARRIAIYDQVIAVFFLLKPKTSMSLRHTLIVNHTTKLRPIRQRHFKRLPGAIIKEIPIERGQHNKTNVQK